MGQEPEVNENVEETGDDFNAQVAEALGVGGEKSEEPDTKPDAEPAVGDKEPGEQDEPKDDGSRTDYGKWGKLTRREAEELISKGFDYTRKTTTLAEEKRKWEDEKKQLTEKLSKHGKLASMLESDPSKIDIVEAALNGDVDKLKSVIEPKEGLEQVISELESMNEPLAKPFRMLSDSVKEVKQLRTVLDNMMVILDPLLDTRLDGDINRVKMIFEERGLSEAFNEAELRKELDTMNPLQIFAAIGEDGKREDSVMKAAMKIFGNRILDAAKNEGAKEERKKANKFKSASSPKSSGGSGGRGASDNDDEKSFIEQVGERVQQLVGSTRR